MTLIRRMTADPVAGLVLVSAAAVLLATPYDGGSCTNVAAAFALPAASVPDAEPPQPSPALADAYATMSTAKAEVTEVEREQADVDELYAAAEEARAAAHEAQDDLWESSYSD